MTIPQPPSYDMDVDLTNCDREPIHRLGGIQPFGFLIVVTLDWLISHASANTEEFIGIAPEDLIGESALTFFKEQAIHDLRSQLQMLQTDDAVGRLFDQSLFSSVKDRFDIAIHLSNRKIIIEMELTRGPMRRDHTAFVRPMIDRIQKTNSVSDLCTHAAKQLRALTGFDRVMVYRFAEDESGEVIAEARANKVDSFLGLRYPASDIPKQARVLYVRSLLRLISNVNGPVIPVMPIASRPEDALDLSLSTLRAVSPIHLEYLRNMGVEASMSVSIVRDGKLWGLFACHHYAPKTLSYDVRTSAELFAQLFSFILAQKESEDIVAHTSRTQVLHDRIMAQLAEGAGLEENAERILDAVSDVIDSDGAALYAEGNIVPFGTVPTDAEIKQLARFLNTRAASTVFHTDSIQREFPSAADFVSRAAGVLTIPVSRSPRDYIMLFRREVARTVTWAGNPEKPVELGPNGARLQPRKSFAEWKEALAGHSDPFKDVEVRAAEVLRVTLLEVVLRMTDAANAQRRQSEERQELLIAELNHRVRNILNLIRSLIAQTEGDVKSVSEFTKVIGGRVHALSRAHDQLTDKNWEPAPFTDLLKTEVDAFLGTSVGRVVITGPEVWLTSSALTTLALVIHELVTNSAKYGALSDSTGRVDVEITEGRDGEACIAWRERGGPVVQVPKRRGFGTTIIERSIPFDLRGEAEQRFIPTGVEADFVIPASYVDRFEEKTGDSEAGVSAQQSKSEKANFLSGTAMVVEDNMIIALDAEEILQSLGAENVVSCSAARVALEALESEQISFALLDVNLGRETSEPVAQALHKKGIPFAFATGYGDAAVFTKQFENSPVVQKPFSDDTIRAAIATIYSAPTA